MKMKMTFWRKDMSSNIYGDNGRASSVCTLISRGLATDVKHRTTVGIT